MNSRRFDSSHPLSESDVSLVREALARGEVLGIPTDTTYGLAADPFSRAGVSRVFELKGRSASKALPILIGEMEQLERLGASLEPALRRKLAAIWPAPLTVVVAVRKGFAATSGEDSAAIRLPAHAALRDLLVRVGPLTATSANRTGSPAATSAAEVDALFGGRLALILDGGPSETSEASTLLDLRELPPRLLRKGPYAWVVS